MRAALWLVLFVSCLCYPDGRVNLEVRRRVCWFGLWLGRRKQADIKDSVPPEKKKWGKKSSETQRAPLLTTA
jgi:hypothetical protein